MGQIRWSKERFAIAGVLVGLMVAASCAVLTDPTEYAAGGDGTTSTDDASVSSSGSGGSDAGSDASLPAETVARLYVTGGERDSLDGYQSMVTDVWVADVDADGALSPWKLTQPAFFRGYFATAVQNDKLYALGQSPDVDSSNRFVIMAAPLIDEGLDTWVGAADPDGNGLNDIIPVIHGEYAYAVGGWYTYTNDAGNQTGIEDEVIVTKLDPAAQAILPWSVAEHIDTGRRRTTLHVMDDHLFVVAGERWSRLASVEVAKINTGDGSLAPFVDLTPMGEDLGGDAGIDEHQVRRAAVCHVGSRIFVIGGDADNGPSDVVMAANFDASMTEVDVWDFETKLPGGLDAPACAAVGSRLYVIGGVGPSSRSDQVLVAEVASDGSLGEWQVSDATLPFGRSRHAVATFSP